MVLKKMNVLILKRVKKYLFSFFESDLMKFWLSIYYCEASTKSIMRKSEMIRAESRVEEEGLGVLICAGLVVMVEDTVLGVVGGWLVGAAEGVCDGAGVIARLGAEASVPMTGAEGGGGEGLRGRGGGGDVVGPGMTTGSTRSLLS